MPGNWHDDPNHWHDGWNHQFRVNLITTSACSLEPWESWFLREIIPKWPNYSAWWIMMIYPDTYIYIFYTYVHSYALVLGSALVYLPKHEDLAPRDAKVKNSKSCGSCNWEAERCDHVFVFKLYIYIYMYIYIIIYICIYVCMYIYMYYIAYYTYIHIYIYVLLTILLYIYILVNEAIHKYILGDCLLYIYTYIYIYVYIYIHIHMYIYLYCYCFLLFSGLWYNN